MTVQNLIDLLSAIKDKELQVYVRRHEHKGGLEDAYELRSTNVFRYLNKNTKAGYGVHESTEDLSEDLVNHYLSVGKSHTKGVILQ